jgi:hypothetical protein
MGRPGWPKLPPILSTESGAIQLEFNARNDLGQQPSRQVSLAQAYSSERPSMGTDTKPKTLHYRRAQFLTPTRTLEDLLSAALKVNSLVANRVETVTAAGDCRLINHTTSHRGLLCGNLIIYEHGANKLFLTVDGSQRAFPIAQVAPPELPNKKRTEFLDSILYFGIKGNHVVLMQSSGLKGKQLELYLNWFLSACGVLGTHNRLELVDHPPRMTSDQLASRPVKKVSYVSAMAHETVQESPRSSSKTEKKLRLTPVGRALDIVRAAIGIREFEKLKLDEALDGNLQVSLEVTYNRSTTQEGQKVINDIARALRNVDGEDISIQVPGLGLLRGDDLKLSKPILVACHNGHVDMPELFDEMHQWLLGLAEGDFLKEEKAPLTEELPLIASVIASPGAVPA